MMQIKNILFPTDFSRCANQALTHALYLARRHQANLHMFNVMVLHEYDPFNTAYNFPNMEEISTSMKEIAKNHMIADLKAYKVDDLVITQLQRHGISTAPTILEYVSEKDIDIIVMGTHGRRGLGHLLLGSIAEEVVRLAPCPVFTIREQKEHLPIETIERILVPIDFSDYSLQALKYATELAVSYKARLQVLHIVEEIVQPSFYLLGTVPTFDLMPGIKEKSKEVMERILDESKGPEVAADIHVIEGNAARDIVKFAASYDTNLIVISTHGLTGIDHLLLGSVTEKVVRMAPCPVFTVKAFGKILL
ncbi:MAG: universal stress protein [Bacteroidetes bacterium]|nr:universal stress protein [Bacteroidota bacterium]